MDICASSTWPPGVPSLTERSSGYLLEVLEPEELERRFGSQPLWFYAYNVLASVGSVLFAEPRSGVFETVSAWLNDRPLRRELLLVATSVVTTGLIAWTAVLHVVATATVGGHGALHHCFRRGPCRQCGTIFRLHKGRNHERRRRLLRACGIRRHTRPCDEYRCARPAQLAVGALLVGALATGWSVRAAGVHYVLRSQAIKHQIDWVELLGRWHRENRWPTDPAEERLILRLHADAVHIKLPNTRIGRPDWPNRLWIE